MPGRNSILVRQLRTLGLLGGAAAPEAPACDSSRSSGWRQDFVAPRPGARRRRPARVIGQRSPSALSPPTAIPQPARLSGRRARDGGEVRAFFRLSEGLAMARPTVKIVVSAGRNRPAGCSSVWLERCVRDAEVAGSNPVTPIDHKSLLQRALWRGMRLDLNPRSLPDTTTAIAARGAN